jgi:hypothetical protein
MSNTKVNTKVKANAKRGGGNMCSSGTKCDEFEQWLVAKVEEKYTDVIANENHIKSLINTAQTKVFDFSAQNVNQHTPEQLKVARELYTSEIENINRIKKFVEKQLSLLEIEQYKQRVQKMLGEINMIYESSKTLAANANVKYRNACKNAQVCGLPSPPNNRVGGKSKRKPKQKK